MSKEAISLLTTIKCGNFEKVEEILTENPSLLMPFTDRGKIKSAYIEASNPEARIEKYKLSGEKAERVKQIYNLVRTLSIKFAIDNYNDENGFNLSLHLKNQGEKFLMPLTDGNTPTQYAGERTEFSNMVARLNREDPELSIEVLASVGVVTEQGRRIAQLNEQYTQETVNFAKGVTSLLS